MINKINLIKIDIKNFQIKNSKDLENFYEKFIYKKNIINNIFINLKKKNIKKKKAIGILLNNIKDVAKKKFKLFNLKINLNKNNINENFEDLTLPPFCRHEYNGGLHPLTIIRYEIISIFKKVGFSVLAGQEIEDDWHNFTALNFPKEHPARDMQDTFFIESENKFLLRTHTSSIQIRVMKNNNPPIKLISTGRVFRKESISSRTHCIFHQLEGFYINKNISFLDLKDILIYFINQIFGNKVKIRFRSSYFPFTEPSVEIDISCLICLGLGCTLCKNTGWVEIMGAGMIDPNVFKNCNVDTNKYSGFAFGMGIERIAMLKYQIDDIRLFTENDIRFLKQFNNI